MDDFEMTIGLEIHLQLATQSKLFCSCGTEFGFPPNTQVCPICMGMPGVLPILNEKAVELAIKAALALECQISGCSKFDRKNYFYPDLPKGYQISQYDVPLAQKGKLLIQDGAEEKEIGITRIHLEEDAGKLIHGVGMDDRSYIDLNRAGIPLIEIVSEPDMASPEEAYRYLKEIKNVLEYVEVSDCNMQEGSLRCDANISVRPKGELRRGVKTEIKNLNSFNHVKRALEYEGKRQWEVIQKGGTIGQSTFMWLEDQERTEEMRSKEYAHDYRYFPEPDLGPLVLKNEWIEQIRITLPELPKKKKARLMARYKLDETDATLLVQDKKESDYFEACVALFNDAQEVVNWMKGKVHGYLNENNETIASFPISPQQLAQLLSLVSQKKIVRNAAKEIFDQMISTGKPASDFAQSKEKIDDPRIIAEICQKTIEKYPGLVADYRQKPNAINALVGRAMGESQGRADVQRIREILPALLNKKDDGN